MNNKQIVIFLLIVILSMSCITALSVPLYNLFCKVTGYGGTTQYNENLPTKKGSRNIKLQFDSNVDKSLQWKFLPNQRSINIVVGESGLAYYHAENLSDEPITGMAVYNVTPHKAGKYFVKIECFCFEKQLLLPKQKIDMPLTFYIDPKIEEDSAMEDVSVITLSYTFFKFKE